MNKMDMKDQERALRLSQGVNRFFSRKDIAVPRRQMATSEIVMDFQALIQIACGSQARKIGLNG